MRRLRRRLRGSDARDGFGASQARCALQGGRIRAAARQAGAGSGRCRQLRRADRVSAARAGYFNDRLVRPHSKVDRTLRVWRFGTRNVPTTEAGRGEVVIEDLLEAIVGKRVLVVGDVMLDEYIWGDVRR